MAAPNLYPLNDFILKVKLKEVVAGSVSATPLTTGTVTGFLSTALTPTATAADASLVATCAHVSGGTWRVSVDASLLTAALLNTHFASATPYLILQQADGFRTYVTLAYSASRAATVE